MRHIDESREASRSEKSGNRSGQETTPIDSHVISSTPSEIHSADDVSPTTDDPIDTSQMTDAEYMKSKMKRRHIPDEIVAEPQAEPSADAGKQSKVCQSGPRLEIAKASSRKKSKSSYLILEGSIFGTFHSQARSLRSRKHLRPSDLFNKLTSPYQKSTGNPWDPHM